MGCGNKLISPKLQEGQQLNGQLIQKVFRSKALYVRPSQTLLEDVEVRNVTAYQISPRTTRAMARSKQLNTIENALYNNDLESSDEELPAVHHPTFCPSHISNPNIPPSATTTTQSTTSISTRSSATDSNPSSIVELCENEPTAHASYNYTTYLSVMLNVSDLSSDDEEINHAILASIETHL
ncbi:hypothetical protein ILYODFUR_039091 [Ilyodon furcidens]|uniref:Uncharacterized protein n=1 Tax=Ilyodon furcidens TaxID=33524 RepID=A0ABV0V1T0_9TELE